MSLSCKFVEQFEAKLYDQLPRVDKKPWTPNSSEIALACSQRAPRSIPDRPLASQKPTEGIKRNRASARALPESLEIRIFPDVHGLYMQEDPWISNPMHRLLNDIHGLAARIYWPQSIDDNP